MLDQVIVCPICSDNIVVGSDSCECNSGHKFEVISGILDLIPDIKNDKSLVSEEKVWDNVAEKGFSEIGLVPDPYIEGKCWQGRLKIFESIIKREWYDHQIKKVCICEIGCGYRSALSFLLPLKFSQVDFIGIDISVKMMLLAKKNYLNIPANWEIQFIRSSANNGIFGENSLDLVFCDGVLARLELSSVVKWISKALKPDGLFIFNDHCDKNIVAKICRKLIPNFQDRFDPLYEGQICILPDDVKGLADKCGLSLIYEKGLDLVNGRLQYLAEIFKVPKPIVVCGYHVARYVDRIASSPSWSYSFTQAYKMRKK